MDQQKKLFCLKGRANVGKSAAMCLIYNKIMEKYHLNSEMDCDLYEPKFLKGQLKEIVVVIRNVNGLTIGIISYGDWGDMVSKKLQLLTDRNCDIIFCTARTRGATVQEVRKMKEKGYEVKFVKKNIADSNTHYITVNEEQADKLLEMAGL